MNKSKWPAAVSAEREDRISYLPDIIIVEILSQLPLTKDAVQTSLLSKRWRYIWTHLHRLSFRFFFDRVRGVLPSTASLASCLAQLASPTLTQLDILVDTNIPDDIPARYRRRLRRPGSKPFGHEVGLVLSYAREKQVKVLSLNFWVLPLSHNRFYDELQITARELNTYFTKGQTWISLKVLDVRWSVLDNTHTREDLLSGFPLLESLILHECTLVSVNITSRNLKKLVFDNVYDNEEGYADVRITTPSLEHLEILTSVDSEVSIELIDVFSLRKASIDLHDGYGLIYEDYKGLTLASEILAQVSHVEEMRLSSPCLKALSVLEIQVFPTLSCKSLILHICQWDRYDFPGLKSVIQNSPLVEKLVLYFAREESYHDYEGFHDDLDFSGAYWKSSSATLHHLRIIHIHEFDYEKSCIEILEFLLKHAMVLEKMVIHKKKSCKILDKLMFSQKLLGFPRSSPTAVVHFLI